MDASVREGGARIGRLPFVKGLGRCARCMRESAFATAAALVAWGSLLYVGWAAWAQAAAFAFAALAALTGAHLVARIARSPAASPCTQCEEKRRAWRRRHFWRLLKWRLSSAGRRHWAERSSSRCRTCGQRTPLQQLDVQPPAHPGLREVVEGSPQFASVVNHLAQPEPTDSWEADMLHYYVYALRPAHGEVSRHALFVARWEDDLPVHSRLVVQHDTSEPQVQEIVAVPVQERGA